MLGVAAADTDDGIGMTFAAPADHRPVFLIRHGGDGTGIDDVAVARSFPGAYFVAHFGQNTLHCLGFVLIDLASKGVKSKLHSEFHQKQRLWFVRIVKPVNCIFQKT